MISFIKQHSLSFSVGFLLFVHVAAFGLLGIWQWSGSPGTMNYATFAFFWLNAALISGAYNALILVLLTKWFREPGSSESTE